MAKKTTALSRLGTKRQCLACGAKYYDLGRKPPVCSRCGAIAEPKRGAEQTEIHPAAEEATVGTQLQPVVAPAQPFDLSTNAALPVKAANAVSPRAPSAICRASVVLPTPA